MNEENRLTKSSWLGSASNPAGSSHAGQYLRQMPKSEVHVSHPDLPKVQWSMTYSMSRMSSILELVPAFMVLAAASSGCGAKLEVLTGTGGTVAFVGAATGGATSFGGTIAATGGSIAAMGGATSFGGTIAATGGHVSATGGAATGGTTAFGGATAATGGAATGGTTSSGAGTAAVCTNVTPCGGNVVGSWTVSSTCLKAGDKLDMTNLGVGCTSAAVTGSSLGVTGTWTANPNGTYTDNTTTTGEVQLTLSPSCLNISGTQATCDRIGNPIGGVLGYESVTCAPAVSGGCNCTGIANQQGGLGTISSDALTGGNYSTSGNNLTMSGGSVTEPYSYCVSGNQLTLTPRNTALTGSVTLKPTQFPTCSNGNLCGGNVVGRWTVSSLSLSASGKLDLSSLGVGCMSATITGGSLAVTGTWTANPDGAYTDNTTTTGNVQFTMAPECLNISGTQATCAVESPVIGEVLGFASNSCTPAAGGGCKCTALINQDGGMGALSSSASTSGNYATAGNRLTMSGTSTSTVYPYGVSGGTLILAAPNTTDPIVLTK